MKYAVIRINDQQFKVSEGEEILIERLSGDKIEPEVLLFVDEKKTLVGNPIVSKVKVKAKALKEEKGEKIRVFKYRSKSRYQKTRGFRPVFTRLLIEKIATS